jgi:hypothetical protein
MIKTKCGILKCGTVAGQAPSEFDGSEYIIVGYPLPTTGAYLWIVICAMLQMDATVTHCFQLLWLPSHGVWGHGLSI